MLSNHDVVRHASRLALTAENPQGHGIGPDSPGKPIADVGLRRARAATSLMLALPGSAYLYQGEELGLPEVIDLPDDARQDPTWFRTHGERYGRDGCRVPLPWTAEGAAHGFNDTGASWLPQPAEWAAFARDVQQADPDSTLNLYTRLLELRARFSLGHGDLEWLDGIRRGCRRLPPRSAVCCGEPGRHTRSTWAARASCSSRRANRSPGTAVPTDTTVWFERV